MIWNAFLKTIAGRLVEAVEHLASTNQGDVKKLHGAEGVYRLRVGDWRVLFSYDRAQRLLLVLRVVNQKDAYKFVFRALLDVRSKLPERFQRATAHRFVGFSQFGEKQWNQLQALVQVA